MPDSQYVSTDPNFGQPMRPQSAARQQADARPGRYVHDMLANVPADLVEQAKNVTTGTYDLLSVLAKATGEVGFGAGNFLRDVIGLSPREGPGYENVRRLASVPGAVVDHYAQYLDPDVRAERVREHPVGMALDMIPVSGVLKAGGSVAASGAKHGAAIAKAAPKRVVQAVIGSPTAAVRGLIGDVAQKAITNYGDDAAKAVSPVAPAPAMRGVDYQPTSAPAKTAPAAPSVPPASSPATPAPAAAASVPESAPVRPVPRALSPQRIQNELGIQARRQGVTLTEPQYKAATDLVSQGKTPAEAVKEIASRTTLTTAAPASVPAAETVAPKKTPKAPARAKLTADEADEYLRLLDKGQTHEQAVEALMQQRQLAKKLGGPSPEEVRQRVARRLSRTNRTSEEAP